MGTRSITIIENEAGGELCRVYRQMDGYPEGHGLDLARAANREIVNGFALHMTAATHANGMGCLAAQIIASLKTEAGLGGIYLEPAGGEIGDWIEYVYTVQFQGYGKPPRVVARKSNTLTRALKSASAPQFVAWAEKRRENA